MAYGLIEVRRLQKGQIERPILACTRHPSSPHPEGDRRGDTFSTITALLLVLLPAATALFFDLGTLTTFEPDKLALLRALVLLLGGWQLMRWRLGAANQSRRWPLSLPVVLVLAALTLSALFSVAPRWSIWGSYQRGQGLLTYLALAGFAYLVYQYRGIRPIDRWLPSAVVWSSVPIVLYGLVQALGWDPWGWQVDPGTYPVFGTLGRSNFLAGFLAIVLPLTVRELLSDRSLWRRRVLTGLLAIQALVLLLTRCRGAWLSVGAAGPLALMAWGLLRRQRQWLTVGIVLCVLGLVVLGALAAMDRADVLQPRWPLLARLASLGENDEGSVAARWTIWQASLRVVGQRPLTGHGLATFGLAFARVYPPQLVYYQGREVMVDHAHNEWINLLVEGGWLGAVLSLVLQLTVWTAGLRYLRRLGRPIQQVQQLCLLTALLINTLINWVSPPAAATLVVSWALYSLVLPPPAIVVRPRRLPSSGLAQAAAGTVALLTAVLWGWLCLRPFAADHIFARAMRSADMKGLSQAQGLLPGQDAYYHIAGHLAGASGAFSLAEQWLVQAVERCPAHPLYWADLGALYLRLGEREPARLNQAEEAFEAAVRINPDQSLWLRGLGEVYLAAGRFAHAETLLRRVVGLDATDALAYVALGDLYYRQMRYDDAALAYMYARDLWPEGAVAHAGLGTAFYALDRCTDAREELERALALGNDDMLTYLSLADCYVRLGNAQDAQELVQEGLRRYPGASELQALVDLDSLPPSQP